MAFPISEVVALSTNNVLLTLGGILLLGGLAELGFERYKIPESVGLMLLGMLLGPVAHVVPAPDLSVFRGLAPVFGAIALVVIVFGGGIRLDLASLRGVGGRGAILALADTCLTIFVIAPVGYFLLHWSLGISVLFGALLGETTAAVVIPVAQDLGIEKSTVDLLTLNSTLNSISCIVAFYIALDAISQTGGSLSLLGGAGYVGRLILVGALIGGASGAAWVFVLDRVRRASFYRMTLGLVVLVYALSGAAGSSSVLAILVFSVIVGNYWVHLSEHPLEYSGGPDELDKQLTSIAFLDKEITFMVKSFFYVFIGLLVTPSVTFALWGLGISLLLLLPRAAGVFAVSVGRPDLKRRRVVMTSLYPRGLTVSVLAGILVNTLVSPPLSVYAGYIFNSAFMVILFSTLISGALIAVEHRRSREILRVGIDPFDDPAP
jgi:cell volume regulation protein A